MFVPEIQYIYIFLKHWHNLTNLQTTVVIYSTCKALKQFTVCNKAVCVQTEARSPLFSDVLVQTISERLGPILGSLTAERRWNVTGKGQDWLAGILG